MPTRQSGLFSCCWASRTTLSVTNCAALPGGLGTRLRTGAEENLGCCFMRVQLRLAVPLSISEIEGVKRIALAPQHGCLSTAGTRSNARWLRPLPDHGDRACPAFDAAPRSTGDGLGRRRCSLPHGQAPASLSKGPRRDAEGKKLTSPAVNRAGRHLGCGSLPVHSGACIARCSSRTWRRPSWTSPQITNQATPPSVTTLT